MKTILGTGLYKKADLSVSEYVISPRRFTETAITLGQHFPIKADRYVDVMKEFDPLNLTLDEEPDIDEFSFDDLTAESQTNRRKSEGDSSIQKNQAISEGFDIYVYHAKKQSIYFSLSKPSNFQLLFKNHTTKIRY